MNFSSSDEYNSGGEGPSNQKKKKVKKCKYTQKYKQKWEKEENFKGWLSKGRSEEEALCVVCNKNILIGSAGKTILLKHKESNMHLKHLKGKKGQQTLSVSSFKGSSGIDEAVKKADLHLAAFVSEHNLSFNIMEHLPNLIKTICPDSEIAKKIQCSRTKCSALIKNCIGKQNEMDIYDILKNTKFSLIVDESTDRGCTKHLAVICRFRYNTR